MIDVVSGRSKRNWKLKKWQRGSVFVCIVLSFNKGCVVSWRGLNLNSNCLFLLAVNLFSLEGKTACPLTISPIS